MAIPCYLAMTAEEMAVSPLPQSPAWMACHFSPYSTGLVNLPRSLPAGSLLILNDRTPIHGHDSKRILAELENTIANFSCAGLLMDFQNPGLDETKFLVDFLINTLSVPAAVTKEYASESAPVFLPPVPTTLPVAEYLAPWRGRTIWLEAAREGQTVTLTPDGAQFGENRDFDGEIIHHDPQLHCRYRIECHRNAAVFKTWRNQEDIRLLLEEAEQAGVSLAVGLYQELH